LISVNVPPRLLAQKGARIAEDLAMVKDLLVNLSANGSDDPAADYAVSVAALFGAHLTGVAYALEPAIPASAMGGIAGDVIDSAIAQSERAARQAIERLDARARKNGVLLETRTATALVADAADQLGELARLFDLSIITQPDPDDDTPNDLFVESALFASGRPVIVVPYIQKAPIALDRVICCWDGSQPAARAIADAGPFLARAGSIELLIVRTSNRDTDDDAGVNMARHLARHDLNVTVQRTSALDIDVGNAILSYAADRSADFLVMGGYGHSRWREFLLGGATRDILATMTLPTLMSH
jgi:nucleotide-binding universal stress UspA family protein